MNTTPTANNNQLSTPPAQIFQIRPSVPNGIGGVRRNIFGGGPAPLASLAPLVAPGAPPRLDIVAVPHEMAGDIHGRAWLNAYDDVPQTP